MVEPPAGEASDPEAQALLADSVAPGADGGARHPRPRRVAAARQRASRARRRVHGTAPPRQARFVQPALVNGTAGLAIAPHGRLIGAIGFTFRDGKIAEIQGTSGPERLRHVDLAAPGR